MRAVPIDKSAWQEQALSRYYAHTKARTSLAKIKQLSVRGGRRAASIFRDHCRGISWPRRSFAGGVGAASKGGQCPVRSIGADRNGRGRSEITRRDGARQQHQILYRARRTADGQKDFLGNTSRGPLRRNSSSPWPSLPGRTDAAVTRPTGGSEASSLYILNDLCLPAQPKRI
jgi:hypothetical protein